MDRIIKLLKIIDDNIVLIVHTLRFHENPSFEKIPKNRCSGAWINGFSSAWCMEFYWVLGMLPRAM